MTDAEHRPARDDYPPGDLMSGWTKVYEALWAELDELRAFRDEQLKWSTSSTGTHGKDRYRIQDYCD